MLKIIGLLMIVGSCSAIGLSMNKGLNERVNALRSFISALQIIKAEIVFRAMPLEDIMEIIGAQCKGVAARFFTSVNSGIQETGQSFWQVAQPWLATLKSAGLQDADVRHITTALHALGRYDAHEQAEIITASLRDLETELESARAETTQKGKLYRALGITAGIAIALIII